MVYFLKRKRFLMSAIFLVGIFLWSILHWVINDDKIDQIRFHTDEKGKLVDIAPYPPFTQFIFGSDQFGYSLWDQLLVGAKYTIGITLVVSLFRLLLSLVMSTFIYSLHQNIFKIIKILFEPFTVVPQTIIAYFILYSVIWMPPVGFHTPFWHRALFETFILVAIAIPNLSIHLSMEMRLVEKESFIEASKTLGASKVYIFFKHIVPHIYEKWILLFGQQFIQVLQLMAHLGFMKLFFGGTFVPYGAPPEEPPHSISYEWSGVVGGSISYLYAHQWIILIPICSFILTAICVAIINNTFKTYFESKHSYYRKDLL